MRMSGARCQPPSMIFRGLSLIVPTMFVIVSPVRLQNTLEEGGNGCTHHTLFLMRNFEMKAFELYVFILIFNFIDISLSTAGALRTSINHFMKLSKNFYYIKKFTIFYF